MSDKTQATTIYWCERGQLAGTEERGSSVGTYVLQVRQLLAVELKRNAHQNVFQWIASPSTRSICGEPPEIVQLRNWAQQEIVGSI